MGETPRRAGGPFGGQGEKLRLLHAKPVLQLRVIPKPSAVLEVCPVTGPHSVFVTVFDFQEVLPTLSHSPPKPHSQNQCQSSESPPVPLPNSLLPPCLFHARPICTLCRPQSSPSLSSHSWVAAVRPAEVLVSAPASSLAHLCSMEGPGMTWYTGLTKCQSAHSIPQGPTLPPPSWAAGDTATSLAVHACHPALPADHLHRAGVLRGALQAQ